VPREPIKAEDLVGEERAEWYRMTPVERFQASERLWDTYLALGGSLEPEPDTQSPFFDPEEWRENALVEAGRIGRTGVRVLRRGGHIAEFVWRVERANPGSRWP
jgi:hypothetical protein